MTSYVEEPAAVTVDARGRRCPIPVIELARRIGEAPVGALAVVLADDPAADTDVPAWCRLRGHDFTGTRSVPDGGTAYVVRRRR